VPQSFYYFPFAFLFFIGLAIAEGDSLKINNQENREKEFARMLSHVTLTGTYTQQGKNTKPEQERYTIYRVAKIPGQEHLWRFDVRLQFGNVDLRVPLPINVRWAGDTPMVVLNDYKIPGLGSFSARVLFDKTRYAGTWQHDKEGGHLFGDIVKEAKQDP
jgi:hypothetical protein